MMTVTVNKRKEEKMNIDKNTIINLLAEWINRRPGLDWTNYGRGEDAARAYRQDARAIARDLRDARRLINAVIWRDGISANDLKAAFRAAYAGRLQLVEDGGRPRLEYCAGQYWPTEYRKAACAVLARALWEYWRVNGEDPRERARREFGRNLAARWF